jgi:alpha-ketoglutarate-dependent taurine dioxygenase
MPYIIDPLRIQPLAAELRKDTKLAAEVLLPSIQKLLDLNALSESDKETLRKALFAHGVLVIRNQTGLDPTALVGLAKLFDPAPLDHHSGGARQVTDPNNILSLNNCSRIPKAPQVTVIGKGRVEGHQGLAEMDLQHLDHLSFHEKPLSADAVQEGFTRPYRWHMDAPLYENLPGIATVLHAVQVPSLPDQRLAFDDDQQELEIAAGATACQYSTLLFVLSCRSVTNYHLSLLRISKLRATQFRRKAVCFAHYSAVCTASI